MMTERSTPDDAMLVRYIDNEASDEERALVDAAAQVDATVAARLAQLQRRSRAASTALRSEDVPTPASLHSFDTNRPPTAEGSRTWLRAAILLGGLGLGAFAVPPVRAWILDVAGIADRQETGEAPVPGPVPIDTVAIFFDAPPEFLIELEEAQRNGQLIVRVADVEQASAELRTAGGTESFFVIPEGIQIVNGDVSTAEYEITLPRSVRDVRVRIPGVEEVIYTTAGNERRVFPIGR